MPERRKKRRLCHINMLKKYYVDYCTPSAPHTPLTVVITSNIAHRERATQEGKGPIDEGFIGVSVRLRNSDVLANLDKKLSHLSTDERNDVAELVKNLLIFSQIHLRELNSSCMMWMWVMQALVSSTLIG